jgi:hypothetical protein
MVPGERDGVEAGFGHSRIGECAVGCGKCHIIMESKGRSGRKEFLEFAVPHMFNYLLAI